MITEETYGTEEAYLNLTAKDGSDIHFTASNGGLIIDFEGSIRSSTQEITHEEFVEMVDALIDFRRNNYPEEID